MGAYTCTPLSLTSSGSVSGDKCNDLLTAGRAMRHAGRGVGRGGSCDLQRFEEFFGRLSGIVLPDSATNLQVQSIQ